MIDDDEPVTETKSCKESVDPHIIHVPQDCTLNQAIDKANKSIGKSYGQVHTIILDGGIHEVDFYTSVYGLDLNYVEILLPLLIQGHPDQTNHPTVVDGGFLIKGVKGEKVTIKDLTIVNSIDSGIHAFKGLNVSAINVHIKDCEGRGMVVQGEGVKAAFSGEIFGCGMSGLSARDAGEILVSCQSNTGTLVTMFDSKGFLVKKKVFTCTCPLTIHANRTRIENNCTIGYLQDYGLEVESLDSKIRFLFPLTKEHVARRNSGGGNWGGEGVIDTTAETLKASNTILVPEEETTIAGAVRRAKLSDGHITIIELQKGYHPIRQRYVNIDFSPLTIVGKGADKSIVTGGGFKVSGEKRKVLQGNGFDDSHKTYLNKPIHLDSFCIVDAKSSGIFAESGLPVVVNNVTILKSSAYGAVCQMTQMSLIDTTIENCRFSGVFSANGGMVELRGPRTRVWRNCTSNREFDFGLRNHGNNSNINVVEPLTLWDVATKNGGGGDVDATLS